MSTYSMKLDTKETVSKPFSSLDECTNNIPSYVILKAITAIFITV